MAEQPKVGDAIPTGAQIGDTIPAGAQIGDQAAQPAAVPTPQREGFTKSYLGDLGAMAKRAFLPPLSWDEAKQRLMGVLGTATGPSGTMEQRDQQLADAQRRQNAGYNPAYTLIGAPFAEGLGVNMRGQEDAAAAGDVGGVLGHAAAVPTAMALGETAQIPVINRALRTGGKLLGNVAADTPIIKNVTPAKIGEAWRATGPQTTPEMPTSYSSDQPMTGPYAPRPRGVPAQPAAPIPPRQGLMLPGEVQPVTAYDNVAGLRSKLTTPDAEAARYGSAEAYENVDPLRQKLTSIEAEHPAMALYGGESLRGVPPSNPLKNFMTENPSALGRIPQPGPATRPVEMPDIVDETRQAVREGRASKIPTRIKTAKPGAPAQPPETPQQPVEPPKKTPPQRQTDYMFGEHGQGADIGSENYRRVRAQTMDELAAYANKKGLKGRTDWTADELRGKQADGKSSKPNAQYIRGQMLKDAGSKPDALGGVGKPEEKPFDPFDEMAAYQPGRSVHDILGLKGGVPQSEAAATKPVGDMVRYPARQPGVVHDPGSKEFEVFGEDGKTQGIFTYGSKGAEFKTLGQARKAANDFWKGGKE